MDRGKNVDVHRYLYWGFQMALPFPIASLLFQHLQTSETHNTLAEGGLLITLMGLILLCYFCEHSYVSWILQATLTLYFGNYFITLPPDLTKSGEQTQPLYLEFAACLFCLIWSHSSDPGNLCRIH